MTTREEWEEAEALCKALARDRVRDGIGAASQELRLAARACRAMASLPVSLFCVGDCGSYFPERGAHSWREFVNSTPRCPGCNGRLRRAVLVPEGEEG